NFPQFLRYPLSSQQLCQVGDDCFITNPISFVATIERAFLPAKESSGKGLDAFRFVPLVEIPSGIFPLLFLEGREVCCSVLRRVDSLDDLMHVPRFFLAAIAAINQ